MKFQINYGNGVLCLPRAVLDRLDRADEGAVKVLLHIVASPAASVSHIAQALSIDVETVKQAIAFWRGTGLIETEQGERKPLERTEQSDTPDQTTATTTTPVPTSLPRYTTEEIGRAHV